MKRITLSALLMTLFLLLSCGSGQLQAEKLAAESKISFFDSLIKIGQGFYEIFGNAIGDTLGLTAVKSDDKKSKVGEHFDKIGKGLKDTKDKLDGLAKDITAVPHTDTIGVEAAIKGVSDVFERLIAALTTLADVTKDNSPLGDTANNAGAAVAADKDGVDTIIKSVNAIIEVAKKSEVEISSGEAGGVVTAAANTAAPAVLSGHNNAAAGANAGPALAAEVSKADPWAMIDKIKDAKTDDAALTQDNNNGAGVLATKTAAAGNNNYGAKTNADLAAAVALKAMTKTGKFSAAQNEEGAVKAAAVTAVNKVLGVLDFIIRKTVAINLDKVGKAVKGIQYSETTTESTEVSATQPAATK
ncbi:variable large family protein [Borrelia turicatae]|uniref:variable large family protein n=1 Tax=Borrelia turicatae TaxID=142 RepID=UPI002ED2DE08